VRSFWKVLADGNLIDKRVAISLPKRDKWEDEDTEEIKKNC
jgi:hypothetical protein